MRFKARSPTALNLTRSSADEASKSMRSDSWGWCSQKAASVAENGGDVLAVGLRRGIEVVGGRAVLDIQVGDENTVACRAA
ncbi:hypothetical protein MASR2M78_09660 [Treponema sp.]